MHNRIIRLLRPRGDHPRRGDQSRGGNESRRGDHPRRGDQSPRYGALRIVFLLLSLLVVVPMGFLGAASAAEESEQDTTNPADCPPELRHYKSDGTHTACVLDPDAPFAVADASAPVYTGFEPYRSTPTGSWPLVLAGDNLLSIGQNIIALATTTYGDAANDKGLHLFRWPAVGNAFERVGLLTGGHAPEAIVADDVNQDGKPDVVLGMITDESLLLYTQPLTTPVRLALPSGPDALATGDFNGDLRSDLAVILPEEGRIVLWKSGPKGLKAMRQTLVYPTGGYDALATGDIDNDGYDDIVALRGAGSIVDSIVVYPQISGTFSFSYTLTPQMGRYLPNSLDVDDVNNDGRDDVVVTAGGNDHEAYLNVFLQQATGLITTPVVYDANDLPSAVEIDDINHDGRNDVTLLNDGHRTASFYIQQPSGQLETYAIAEVPYSSRYRPDALEVVDVDGNGSLDVTLVDRGNGLTVLKNTLSAPTSTITYPPEASLLAPGRFTVRGLAGPTAVAVQVRLKGSTDWLPATLTGGTWTIDLELPNQPRNWWIEARAIDAQGHVQAPPARRRIRGEQLCYLAVDNADHHGSRDELYRIDPTNAQALRIGYTRTDMMHALVFKPGTDTLYTADDQRLGLLNRTTGVYSGTASTLGRGNGSVGRITYNNIVGLAFDPRNTTLYGIDRRSKKRQKDVLLQIDPVTGSAIPNAFGTGVDYLVISTTGVLDDLDDIAFDPRTNKLYAITNNDGKGDLLLTLDPRTGAATIIGSPGIQNIEGLGFDSVGQLYGSTGSSGSKETRNRFWQIDPISGTATLVGRVPYGQDFEGIACLSAGVPVPLTTPIPAPRLATFAVSNEAPQTANPTVQLAVTADDEASGEVEQVTVGEYVYRQEQGRWENVAVRTVDYTAAASGITWELSPVAGMKYLLARSGNRNAAVQAASDTEQTFINYIPATGVLAQGERHIYRYTLNAGDSLEAQVQSQTGDADLYVWSSDPEAAPLVSNLRSGADKVRLTAPADGLYQIEVAGATDVTYQLTVAVTAADDETAATSVDEESDEVGGVDPDKTLPGQPGVPLESVPNELPQQSQEVDRLFLPLLVAD